MVRWGQGWSPEKPFHVEIWGQLDESICPFLPFQEMGHAPATGLKDFKLMAG